MHTPSPLGLAVERAIDNDPRFKRDRDAVKYGVFFRTLAGTPFLIERRTQQHINLWVPEFEAARAAAEHLGLKVTRSVPYTLPEKYGRISTLKTIPDLRDRNLDKISVTRPEEALAVLGALP